MTLRRFEEPHPPTPLSASREGGVEILLHICREGGVFLLIAICSPPHKLCAICSERFSEDSANYKLRLPVIFGLANYQHRGRSISDFSRHLEKPTRNLTPQPPSLTGNGENSKPLKKQERGMEAWLTDPVKSKRCISTPPRLRGGARGGVLRWWDI